jgi:hypothetical protein
MVYSWPDLRIRVEPGTDPEKRSILMICFNSAALTCTSDRSEWYKCCKSLGCDIMFVKECSVAFYSSSSVIRRIDDVFYRIPEENRRCVWTVGLSSGGFAALVYGCRYRASRVMAVSPQTNHTDTFHKTLTMGGTLRRAAALEQDPGAIHEVNAQDLERNIQGRVLVVYPMHNAYDVAQVAPIKDAKCVDSRGLPSGIHRLSGHRKELLSMFDQLFGA